MRAALPPFPALPPSPPPPRNRADSPHGLPDPLPRRSDASGTRSGRPFAPSGRAKDFSGTRKGRGLDLVFSPHGNPWHARNALTFPYLSQLRLPSCVHVFDPPRVPRAKRTQSAFLTPFRSVAPPPPTATIHLRRPGRDIHRPDGAILLPRLVSSPSRNAAAIPGRGPRSLPQGGRSCALRNEPNSAP